MSSIFTSISNAITTVFDATTNIIEATDETLTAATSTIRNRAVSYRASDTIVVRTSTAKRIQEAKQELANNPQLQEEYDLLDGLFK